MPTIPDRIVIHSDNSPNPSQDHQPPALKQPSAVPQPGVIQTPGKKDETAPVKSRLGFPRKFSDTLELKKIPRELNNIAKLNEHFQRFGTIRNIQVNLNTLTLLVSHQTGMYLRLEALPCKLCQMRKVASLRFGKNSQILDKSYQMLQNLMISFFPNLCVYRFVPLEILKQHLFSFLITKNVKQLILVPMLSLATDLSGCFGTTLTGTRIIRYTMATCSNLSDYCTSKVFQSGKYLLFTVGDV